MTTSPKTVIIRIKNIHDVTKLLLLHELDRGEAEVIILAQERCIKEVIIDERVSRRQAHISGLNVVGTLGLLLRAKKRGIIDKIKPSIKHILHAGIYIHQDVVLGIINEAGKS